MLLAQKYRIKPNDNQKLLIDKTIGCSRKVYNLMLGHNIENYKQTKKCSFPEVTHFKKIDEYKFLNEVDSLALANAKLHVQTSFKNFFRSLKKKKGRKSGFPKFKSKHKAKLSYTTNNVNNSIRIEEIDGKNFVKIPKLGLVELIYHREIEGKIKSITITKLTSDKYDVSILFERENKTNNKYTLDDLSNLNVVGVDMSFHDLAVFSTGEKANHPKYYRKSEKRLSKFQRNMHLKQKGSNNRKKAKEQ